MNSDSDMFFHESESGFVNFFNDEDKSMVAEGYEKSNQAILRRSAMKVILQNSRSDEFDAFIPYLAMTFVDRFLSINKIPTVIGGVDADLELFANSCLTIAHKMRNQTLKSCWFQERNIWKSLNRKQFTDMEFKILEGLEWQMCAPESTSFVPFFIEKCSVKGIRRRLVNQIIIESKGDISFTQFKPSVIAAAAIVEACCYENVEKTTEHRCIESLIDSRRVNKDDLDCCREKLRDMCVKKQIFVEESLRASCSFSEIHKESTGMDFQLKWQLDIGH